MVSLLVDGMDLPLGCHAFRNVYWGGYTRERMSIPRSQKVVFRVVSMDQTDGERIALNGVVLQGLLTLEKSLPRSFTRAGQCWGVVLQSIVVVGEDHHCPQGEKKVEWTQGCSHET